MTVPLMTKQKKLLLAGGGYADIPLIQAAQRQGFYVITSGNRAQDPGHQVSDEYRAADFSDPEAMLALATSLAVDAICACCNDFAALSAAYVAEKLGLPGHDPYETAKIIHHKDLYRQFAQQHGIPTPRAESFTDVATATAAVTHFQFPVMIKPVDLTGGKGIVKISSMAEAQPAITNAFNISKSKRIVIEEYVEGSNHGFTCILRDGKVVFHFSDNEHYYLNKYMVSAASTPAKVPASAIAALQEQAENIASLLKLKNGIFHVQYILQPDGKPIIIEICRRAPGDLYIKLVEHATGVDYPGWIVKSATGQDLSALKQVEPRGCFTRHCIMTDRNGVLERIDVDPSVANRIIDQYVWWHRGDKVENYLTHKFGIVFLKFDDMNEMLAKTNAMQSLIKAIVGT